LCQSLFSILAEKKGKALKSTGLPGRKKESPSKESVGKQGENSSHSLFEPFAKVLEWFNFQVNMEEVYRFPLLRLKLSDALSPFVIPAKAGIQRKANEKRRGKPRGNAVNRIVPDIGSRFRGNDEKRNCVYTPM
jgi:hypothetical protein